MTIYIYALRDPRTNSVCYIGQSQNPQVRLHFHKQVQDGTPKSLWLQEVVTQGYEPMIEILEVIDDNSASIRERYWIEEMLSKGEPLTNVCHASRHTAKSNNVSNMTGIKVMGKRVLERRQLAGLTSVALANLTGTSAAQISRVERNQRLGVSAVLIGSIAQATSTNVEYLLGMTDDPAPLRPPSEKGVKASQLMTEWVTLFHQLSPERQVEEIECLRLRLKHVRIARRNIHKP